jgi:hypothetical protein
MHKPILTLALIAAIGAAALTLSLHADTIEPSQSAAAAIARPSAGFPPAAEAQENRLSDEEISEWYLSLQAGDYATFIHPTTGLSFTYPKTFARHYDVYPEGDTFFLHDNERWIGIQLFTQAFDEPPESLMYERIRRDLPDLEMTNLYIFPLYAGRIELRFKREDPDLGPVREHWIAKDGYLTQIIVYAPDPLRRAFFNGLVSNIKFLELPDTSEPS